MVSHVIDLPNSFYVVSVQVATVWTDRESSRNLDTLAVHNPTDVERWLDELTYDQKVALCDENRIQTQALYGEAVIIEEIQENWAKVLIPSQPSRKNRLGYPGWVPLNQLTKVEKDQWIRPETVAIHTPYTWLEDDSGNKLLKLSFMTCLPVSKIVEEKVEVITPKGKGFLKLEHVSLFPTQEGCPKGDGESIVRVGEPYIGLDYLWGGMSAFGYDCSGFAYQMHKANGYLISRDASDQAAEGVEIALDQLQPGDLLFFAYEEGKGRIHHVGIYYGDGKMLHSPMTGRGIEIVALPNTKYEKELCIARRYWEVGV